MVSYADVMKTVSVDRASEDLVALIHEVTECSEPIQILNGAEDAVLVSAADWRSIQETLYLKSIPGLAESIIEGLNAPAEEFSDDPGWD